VTAPTLLLHGQQSPAFLRRLSDRLEELLPNVRRIEVPGASHMMHEDNPQAVNEAIAGFLRGFTVTG
jgi:pimeloyl-ACP methyl ester carboxylesterase